MPKDPNKLNVYVGGSLVPGGGTDGWLIDGQSVTLIGAACDRVQTDAGVPTLQVVEGCQTVR
jgi:hypothetical protein